jgi:23S rRNA (adenine-N6)-dimethyltransferase
MRDLPQPRVFVSPQSTNRETEFSVLAKPRFTFQVVRSLNRRDFSPVPSVACVLLQIEKRRLPLVCEKEMALYRRFIRFGFRRWRRNLKLTFKPVFSYRQWKRLAKELGFEMNVRPSDLRFEQWLGLFECFKRYVPAVKQRNLV